MMNQSVFNDTVDLLKTLDPRQLSAVHSIVVELAGKNAAWQSPLNIETETQLWNHIDQSLAHAKQGKGRDADDVISDIMQEYAL